MVIVSTAAMDQIPLIRHLAEKTWKVAYAEILSPAQMDYMLQLFYSEPALQEQFAKGHRFLLACENELTIGFASFSPKSAAEPGIFRLHKLYIDPDQQGKGVGKTLINHIISEIKKAGATDLELNVNRHNPAKQFYSSLGFLVIRSEDIDIGEGYFMNDYVMNLKL